MSGPIIRKYGFPNHEQIFGSRPPEHGVEKPKDEKGTEAKKPDEKAKADDKGDQRGA